MLSRRNEREALAASVSSNCFLCDFEFLREVRIFRELPRQARKEPLRQIVAVLAFIRKREHDFREGLQIMSVIRRILH